MLNKKFFSRVLGLLFGRVAGAIIVFATLPIITRIYSPEAFGGWVVWFGIALILSSGSSLAFAQAIVLPKSSRDSFALLQISLISSILFAIVSILISGYLLTLDFWYVSNETSAIWSTGLGFMVLSLGTSEAMWAWWVRNKKFKLYALFQTSAAASGPLFQILFSYFYQNPLNALIMGSVVGQVTISLITLGIIIIENERPCWSSKKFAKTLFKVAYIYKEYPKYILPYNILGTLRDRITHILIAEISIQSSGFFGLASRVNNIPNNLLAASFKPVFYQLIARSGLDEIENDFLNLLVSITIIITPPWILFILFNGDLFSYLFGEPWRAAGLYAVIISFSAIPNMLGNWAERIFDITNNQKLMLRLETIFGTIAIFSVFLSAKITNNILLTLTVLSITMTIYYLVFLYNLFCVSNFKIKSFFKVIFLWITLGISYFLVFYSIKINFSYFSAIKICFALSIGTALFSIWKFRTRITK